MHIPVVEMVQVFVMLHGPEHVDQGNGDAQQENAYEEAHPGHVTVSPIEVDLESLAYRDRSGLWNILVYIAA